MHVGTIWGKKVIFCGGRVSFKEIAAIRELARLEFDISEADLDEKLFFPPIFIKTDMVPEV